jgi:hypothetical protein
LPHERKERIQGKGERLRRGRRYRAAVRRGRSRPGEEESMQRALSFLIIAAVFVACTDKSNLVSPPTGYSASFDSISITDEEILQLVYSSFKLPSDFYQEDVGSAGIYYENTISILPLGQRTSNVSELSTNSHIQALAWSESSSVHSAYYRTLQSELDTDRYFQFRRVYQAHPTDVLLSRVHKLSYLDRSMFDNFHPTSLAGVLNVRPIDGSNVLALAQYFWFIHNYNTHGAKALATAIVETADTMRCALYEIQVSYGDWGVSDEIGLIRQQYSVSERTGSIHLTSSVVRTIRGRSN